MKINEFTDLEQWATQQWESADLGDARRNDRAIEIGAKIAANPSASLPEQMESWSALKAAYRLFNEKDVTHSQLSQPHWQTTRTQARLAKSSVVLFVQDTTELDYSQRKDIEGLGHIGDGKGKGMLLHSCVAVLPNPGNPAVLGLAAQSVWMREQVKSGSETRSQRAARRTEADVWAEIVEEIGPAPASDTGVFWVSVGDRGSDVFSYLRRSQSQGWHCLMRICQDRVIETVAGDKSRLKQFARSLPTQATKEIVLRGRDGQPKRSVELQLSWQQVKIVPPVRGGKGNQDTVEGWCIRCWEPTGGAEGLEWILWTSVPITNAASASVQVDWYAHRWVIEEYHKCLKSGCAVQARQLTTAVGLQRVLGFLAIVAVKLLQLRMLSRTDPECLASTVIPPLLLQVLAARLGLFSVELTLGQFWLVLARLGGFLARQSDGLPGWQTLWRGWQRLQDLCWGATFTAGVS